MNAYYTISFGIAVVHVYKTGVWYLYNDDFPRIPFDIARPASIRPILEYYGHGNYDIPAIIADLDELRNDALAYKINLPDMGTFEVLL